MHNPLLGRLPWASTPRESSRCRTTDDAPSRHHLHTGSASGSRLITGKGITDYSNREKPTSGTFFFPCKQGFTDLQTVVNPFGGDIKKRKID
ncbi:hypothetical protein Misp02_32680 [Microtetraspora sp. NBRC 16547]|nr:hypothetical protein Misp02_32680 [Microtetraspora sp. NBRC 16547]